MMTSLGKFKSYVLGTTSWQETSITSPFDPRELKCKLVMGFIPQPDGSMKQGLLIQTFIEPLVSLAEIKARLGMP